MSYSLAELNQTIRGGGSVPSGIVSGVKNGARISVSGDTV